MKLPPTLKPSQVVILRDHREKTDLDLSPLSVVDAHLTTADYTVRGLEQVIAVEYKSSMADIVNCCGADRSRFSREVMRLLAFPTRALVIAGTWAEVEEGRWRNKVSPASVFGSLVGWSAMGLPVIMAGNQHRAGRIIAKLAYITARRRYRELRALGDVRCWT